MVDVGYDTKIAYIFHVYFLKPDRVLKTWSDFILGLQNYEINCRKKMFVGSNLKQIGESRTLDWYNNEENVTLMYDICFCNWIQTKINVLNYE